MAAATFRLSGPLFDGTAVPRLQTALHGAMVEARTTGQTLVREQLYPGHGYRTGRLWRSTLGGGTWDHGFVGSPLDYAPPVESGRPGTRFRGYQMFRNATDKLNDGRLVPPFQRALREALGG